MKFTTKIVWISLSVIITATTVILVINNSIAKPTTILSSQRTEEYAFITYSNLDKDNVIIWYGHNKKETVQITKDQPVVDPVINIMHSLNSEGWELVNNESFPYLNILGSAGNMNSEAFHTILFVMKRKLTPPDPSKEE